MLYMWNLTQTFEPNCCPLSSPVTAACIPVHVSAFHANIVIAKNTACGATTGTNATTQLILWGKDQSNYG